MMMSPIAQVAAPTTAPANGLLAQLAREADEAIAACEVAAQTEATALRENAAQDAEHQLRDVLAAQARTHLEARVAVRARAEQRVRSVLLHARADAIERVIGSAQAQADSLVAHPGLEEMLRADIVRALRFLPDGPVVVRCPPAIADLVRTVATTVDVDRIEVNADATMTFGLIVRSGDSRIDVDATIARRLASDGRRLSIRISRLLTESFA